MYHDHGKTSRTSSIVALLLAAAIGGTSIAADSQVQLASGTILEPAVWQGPEFNAPPASDNPNVTVISGASVTNVSTHAAANPLRMALQPAPPIPPQNVQMAPPGSTLNGASQQSFAPANPTTGGPTQPLLDGNSPTEDLLPAVVCGEGCEGGEQLHVQPYGGGHPTDWSWGCGGSPYRNGPGLCDNYKVGPRWHFTFDGLVMSRDETNLVALQDQMEANLLLGTVDNAGAPLTPSTEQFGYGPGGRITFTSEVPAYVGYQLQGAYEGIIDWDASIIYPKIPNSVVDANTGLTIPNSSTQRTLHYTTDYNSGEVSWVRSCDENWHPFCGFRYIKVGDRLKDFLDQTAPPPLPGPPISVPNPLVTTDVKNLVDIDNNLMGFQLGMLHESWALNRRFSIDGFVNGGVYYNKVKYFNRMGTYSTQTGVDDPATPAINEGGTFVSNSVNDDESDLSEISYTAEASISGVCRLNKCWQLRAGYQVLWINQLHLADAAFLGNPSQTDDLLFQGWHAGFECRR